MGRGNFGEKVAPHCKVMGHSAVSCSKMAATIEMPFGMKTRVGPRNHMLEGGQDSPTGKGIDEKSAIYNTDFMKPSSILLRDVIDTMLPAEHDVANHPLANMHAHVT